MIDNNYLARQFSEHQKTDADYMIRCVKGTLTAYGPVPNEIIGESIDEAIKHLLAEGWKIIEFYDLYSPLETAMIRRVEKV